LSVPAAGLVCLVGATILASFARFRGPDWMRL
jgi:hypothetical protein